MPLPALTEDELKLIDEAVKSLDPDEEFVALDLQAGTVRYSSDIQQDEHISTIRGHEEVVRAYVVSWLCKTGGYPATSLRLEKRYPYGSGGTAELDIRVSRPDSDVAYALIELKSPSAFGGVDDSAIRSQLFSFAGTEPGTRVLSLATVVVDADNTARIEAVTVDFEAHPHWEQWKAEDSPHRGDIPINYEEPTVEPYIKGSDKDLDISANRTMLNQRRKLLHDRLWGGGNDDNAIYGWLVRFFLAKIHDERTTNRGHEYALQVKHQGSRKEGTRDTVARLNAVWEVAYKKYIDRTATHVEPLSGGLFSDADVAWVVETMQGISLASAGHASGDLLGAFFESITRDGFKQSKGLFFTHFNIAIFMIEALNLAELAEEFMNDPSRHSNDRLPYVMDPSAGSGTFLLAAMRAMTQHLDTRRDALATNDDIARELERWLPRENPNQWAAQFLYGLERREDLAISTKVNMVLHRDGSTHVYNHDALASLNDIAEAHGEAKFRASVLRRSPYPKPVAETMDVIITNPPFSITLDTGTQRSLADNFVLADESNSENLFVERWYQLLKPGGRLAAVMPESTFSTAENARVRRFLFAHFHIRAVVSLPPHTFQPWTPTRTSLVFASKKTLEEVRVWDAAYSEHYERYADAKREGLLHCGRLVKPRRRDTNETLAASAELVVDSATLLGIATHEDDFTEDGLLLLRARLRSVDVDQLAFASTVTEVASSESYVGVAVSEVGYKRTKRSENVKPNDLFNAVAEAADGTSVRIRNLNDAPQEWRMILTDDASDALSVLKQAALWE